MILNFLLFYNTLSRNQRQFFMGIIVIFFLILNEVKVVQQAIKEVHTAQKNYVTQYLLCKQYAQNRQYKKHLIESNRKQINGTKPPIEAEWVGILIIDTQYWAFLKQADQTIIALGLNQHIPGSSWQIIALTKKQIVLADATTHTQWIKNFS